MNAPTREEFLTQRMRGLGGSDIGSILGVNKWKSPVAVWMDKTGRAERDDMSEPAYWGLELEDVVAREYAKRSGNKVQRVNAQLQHTEHDWMLANIDRAVVIEGSRARIDKDGKLVGIKGLLECKTASAYCAKEWEGEKAPLSYVAQCQWYMAVTGADWCDLAVLIGGQKYICHHIERDEGIIKMLIDQGLQFWVHHVLADIPPPAMTAEEALMLFPRNTGEEAVIADEESILALRNLEQIKEQIKNLEAQAEAAKAIIQQAIGENSALIDTDGTTLVTWKNNKDGQKTDWKKTEDDLKGWAINTLLQPELVEGIRSIIDSNTQKTKGARPFIIK